MCFEMLIADQQAREQAKVNRAKYKVRDANNEVSATESAVQKWGQSLRNRNLLNAAGDNFGTLAENFARRVDARTMSSAMGRLAHSEELGRVSAAAAAAGVGGSSVDMFNRTIETSYQLQAQLADRAGKSEDYLAQRELARVIPDAINEMDNNLYMANMDYSWYGDPKSPSALGTIGAAVASAAFTAAGMPQVGQAIEDMRTSELQGGYGLGDGGAAKAGSALKAFKGGVGEIRSALRRPRGQVPGNSLGGAIYNAPDLSRVGRSGGLGNISNGSLSSITFR